MTRLTLTTPNAPGAVAVLQLHGGSVAGVLGRLTGRGGWADRRAYLCDFSGVDEGLAVLLSGHTAQLMPHGGPRVVQRLIEHLTRQLGCIYDAKPDTQVLYPEASSPIEADMLDAIARAASPAAIDLLSEQPALWRGLVSGAGWAIDAGQRHAIAERSRTLDKLVMPPTVVVIGPPNAGKSTLINALMGQPVSIVCDLPGTTRDWVGGLVELSPDQDPQQAVAVQWLDTPGLRASDDAIEQRAIALARQQIQGADVLVALRSPGQPWPDTTAAGRAPDLWAVNKSDDAAAVAGGAAGRSPDHPLPISAAHGNNLDALQALVVDRLGLAPIGRGPWAFSPTLVRALGSGPQALAGYL